MAPTADQDEEDSAYIAGEAGISFVVVQKDMRRPLVYASELGTVQLTVRRHYISDGAGHLSPHYDVISYETPTIKSYEELAATTLDAYRDFLL